MAEDMKLTKLERIFLVNQLKILETLYPDEAEQLSVQREALEQGYEMLYAWHTEHIYEGDDVMTTEESREVWDTMEMFDAIDRSLSKLPQNQIDEKRYWTKFMGYDGNHEGKFKSFAQFTVERMKRFDYLPMAKPGYFNSHMPVRDIYRRMLAEWQKVPSQSRFDLNEGDLIKILSAAVHPESREK